MQNANMNMHLHEKKYVVDLTAIDGWSVENIVHLKYEIIQQRYVNFINLSDSTTIF
jgi:hypothetical protein